MTKIHGGSGGSFRPASIRPALTAIAATMAAVALVLTVSTPAQAATTPDSQLAQLVQLNPGTTEAEMHAAVEEAAAESGATYEETLAQMLTEAEANVSVDTCGPVASKTEPGPDCQQSSGGDGPKVITLPTGRNKGDVFHSWARTLKVTHNHVGLYYASNSIIEAPGGSSKSRHILVSATKVAVPVYQMYVDTSQATRDATASYAFNNLRAKPYQSNFAFNKNGDISKLNCSELVWWAYMAGGRNVNLDHDGGKGVYPNDIKNSSKTTIYRTIKS